MTYERKKRKVLYIETTQSTKSQTAAVKITRKQRLAAHREFQKALRDEMRKGPVK